MIKKAVTVLSLLAVLSCSGCWDWRIIDELAVIFGIGIDMVEEEPEQFLFTFVNPIFEEEAEEVRNITSVRGYSLAQALINLQHQEQQQPVLGKVDVIIFSEEAAQSGAMHQIMRQYDQIRDKNPRASICIVRGTSAQDVINLSPPEQPRTAVLLGNMLRHNFSEGRMPEVSALTYWTIFNTRGITPVIPVIELTGMGEEQTGILLAGLAIIDEDGRLKGYLSDTETLMYMLLTSNILRGRFHTRIDYREQENRILTGFVQSNSTGVQSRIVQDKAVINIKTDIILTGINVDLLLDSHLKENVFRELEQALARDIQGNMLQVLRISQACEADFVGLGQHVRVKHPEWFRGKNWTREFGQSTINLEVSVTIKRFNSLINPNY